MSSRTLQSPSQTPNSSRIRLKGLFAGGIWKCNCEPRLPASNFQTKNGGKNHGRWFYTCQRTPPQSCGFFLWADEAQAREASAVMNNSRTEPRSPTRIINDSSTFKTPVKPGSNRFGPHATSQSAIASFQNAQKPAPVPIDAWDEDSSDDDEMIALADIASQASATPRKSSKTGPYASPGKSGRDRANIARERSLSPSPATRKGASVPRAELTPSTSETPRASRYQDYGLPQTPSRTNGASGPIQYPFLTPSDTIAGSSTPSSTRFAVPATPSSSIQPKALKADIFAKLREANITLPPKVAESIGSICDKHGLRALGFERGRDASRKALKAKEVEIAKCNERIHVLQTELEVEIAKCNERIHALQTELEVDKLLLRRLRRGRESTVDTELTRASEFNDNSDEEDDDIDDDDDD